MQNSAMQIAHLQIFNKDQESLFYPFTNASHISLLLPHFELWMLSGIYSQISYNYLNQSAKSRD